MKNIPTINGKPCKPAPKGHYSRAKHLNEAFAPWLCPECGAALGISLICLNACHLSQESRARMNSLFADVAERHKRRRDK